MRSGMLKTWTSLLKMWTSILKCELHCWKRELHCWKCKLESRNYGDGCWKCELKSMFRVWTWKLKMQTTILWMEYSWRNSCMFIYTKLLNRKNMNIGGHLTPYSTAFSINFLHRSKEPTSVASKFCLLEQNIQTDLLPMRHLLHPARKTEQ